MMFRWFVGMSMEAPVWDVTPGDIARGLLAALLADPRVQPLLSDEHFSFGGTLIET